MKHLSLIVFSCIIVIADLLCIIIEFIAGDETICNYPDLCRNGLSAQRAAFLGVFGVYCLGLFAIGLFGRAKSNWSQKVHTTITGGLLAYESWYAQLFWRLSHYLFYMLLGYISPCYWKECFALSALWEFCECTIVGRKIFGFVLTAKEICEKEQTICGGMTDLLLNALGLTTGIMLHQFT